VNVPLLCGNAEYLPFPPEHFDHVVGLDVLEHSQQQDRLLEESARVLKPGGALFLLTPNRFSLRPEPCVRVWGVGFLPRKWMSRYVRWVRQIPYENVRLLSCFEIRRRLWRAGFPSVRLALPRIDIGDLGRFSRWERWQIALYEALRRWPLVRWL